MSCPAILHADIQPVQAPSGILNLGTSLALFLGTFPETFSLPALAVPFVELLSLATLCPLLGMISVDDVRQGVLSLSVGTSEC